MKWKLAAAVLLMALCGGCESGSDGYSTASLEGAWVGDFTLADNETLQSITFTFVLVMDSQGTVTSFTGGPAFTSLNGGLQATEGGAVSGTIVTIHDTQYGPETWTWPVNGQFASQDRLVLSISARWENPGGQDSGTIIVNADLARGTPGDAQNTTINVFPTF